MYIEKTEVAAIEIDDKVYHVDCCTGQDEITEDNVLTWDEINSGDNYLFCDECGKLII